MKFLVRAAVAVVAVGAASACATGGPPEAPPRIEAPGLGVGVTGLGDHGEGGPYLPPPVTEAERADPIVGSRLADDPEVRRRMNYWILRWQTWGQGHFGRYLERMQRYGDLVQRQIEKRELPASLRYLPVVESGYNPDAVSPAGAAGMWQFMSGTARFLGLEVTPLIDERRDPWKATGVALDYLAELRDRFEGSWFLALAAYNSGWGRVEGILERHGDGAEPSDSLFWALRDHFPRETRDFVPKLLAAARLARQPEAYGFRTVEGTAPVRVEEVRVPDATSLDVVARAAGVEVEAVAGLNPHILRGYTPPDRETTLRIPAGTGERFARAYEEIPAEKRVSFVEHKVERGETLTRVASLYGVGLDELRAANPDLRPRRLQIGEWIVVPRSPTDDATGSGVRRVAAASAARGPSTGDAEVTSGGSGRGSARVHRIRRGESLWTIARRYGVGIDDLRRWNDLGEDPVIHPGDELRIHGAEGGLYRVRAGDTLSEIAWRHGVGTEALLRANDLSRGSVIRPGDEVRIPEQGGS